MAKRELWARRVAEWKSSGLTSLAYSDGKPFTAGGLRHWAYRLRKEEMDCGPRPAIRMRRVLRVRAPDSPAPTPPAAQGSSPVTGVGPAAVPLIVEIGVARVAVPSGFDRETLTAVLDALAARGGR